jgi:hypothetical protein
VATLAQIALKTTTALTALERAKTREVLGSTLDESTDAWTALEDTFDALSGVQNQHVKAYLDDWDRISIQPVVLSGGADALEYETDRHRFDVANLVRVALGMDAIALTEYVPPGEGWQVVNITLPTYTITEDADA